MLALQSHNLKSIELDADKMEKRRQGDQFSTDLALLRRAGDDLPAAPPQARMRGQNGRRISQSSMCTRSVVQRPPQSGDLPRHAFDRIARILLVGRCTIVGSLSRTSQILKKGLQAS